MDEAEIIPFDLTRTPRAERPCLVDHGVNHLGLFAAFRLPASLDH
jgi:hypothetical protein